MYSSGGEVLMGTLRWEKEAGERARAVIRETESGVKRRELQFAEADTSARIAALQLDLERQRAALELNTRNDAARHVTSGEQLTELRRLRGANGNDSVAPKTRRRSAARVTRSGGNGRG